MNQRQAIVFAMRLRPRFVRRRRMADLACWIHGICSNTLWKIRNPRFAWFCYRVRLHYSWGFPLPPTPPHRIEA